MSKTFVSFALMAALAPLLWAQSATRLQRLEVAIWPEYDQPGVLVMYRGWLPGDEPLPTTVTLPMPAEVEVPNAVAKRGPGTGLLVAPYTVEAGTDWQRVHLQTDLPEIRLEFYVDLATDTPERYFPFRWPGGPAIANLAYEVMQPMGASGLDVTPRSKPPSIGSDGLTYQLEELGSVPGGGEFFIDIRYTKASPQLTVSALAPPSPPPTAAPRTPVSPENPVFSGTAQDDAQASSVWQVVIPVLILAAIAAAWIVLSSRRPSG